MRDRETSSRRETFRSCATIRSHICRQACCHPIRGGAIHFCFADPGVSVARATSTPGNRWHPSRMHPLPRIGGKLCAVVPRSPYVVRRSPDRRTAPIADPPVVEWTAGLLLRARHMRELGRRPTVGCMTWSGDHAITRLCRGCAKNCARLSGVSALAIVAPARRLFCRAPF